MGGNKAIKSIKATIKKADGYRYSLSALDVFLLNLLCPVVCFRMFVGVAGWGLANWGLHFIFLFIVPILPRGFTCWTGGICFIYVY